MGRSAGEGMKICPFCAEEVRAEAVKCRYCGERLDASAEPAPPPPAAPLSPSPAAIPPAGHKAPDAPAFGAVLENLPSTVYRPDFDLDSLPADIRRAAMAHTLDRPLPIWLAIVASIVTFNFFFAFYYPWKHGRLPKLVSGDPGGFKAWALMFVPIVNVYWLFVMWMRLADRLNFQLRLRNMPDGPNRVLPAVAVTVMLAGFFVAGVSTDFVVFMFALNWLVLVPLFVSQLQGAINDLVRADSAPQTA